MANLDKNQMNHNESPASDFMQRLWDARVVLALGLTAVLCRAYYYNAPPTAVPSKMVTTSEVVYKTTKEAIGKTVTISSKPIQKVGSSFFTVSDQKFLDGKPIVVINASGVPFDLPNDRNTNVQVTGQVRNLVIPKVERDFHLKLQDESYKNYVNKPAIIAKSIALAPELSQITQNPSKYYGKRLAIMGKVENIQSPVLFTLDKNQFLGAKELLVLLKATPTEVITQGNTVALTGIVRPFVVADITREHNLNWNPQVKTQMEAQYHNKPVLVADVVSPDK